MNKAVLVFPFIILSLLAAIWAGWIRIGWTLPITNIAALHGALMVNSFLASLIFLERAVTFKNKLVLLLPLANALSGLAFAAAMTAVGQILFIIGSLGFAVMCCYFIYYHKELYYYVFLGAAICLTVGNIILFRTNFYPHAVNWWIGFLLFTIVGERLELSKFLPLNKAKRILLMICLASILFAIVLPSAVYGNFILAIAMAATALWLLKYDMAKRSIKASGQHRYSGILLLAGFIWLLIMALLLFFYNHLTFGYDAVLHSFFIGFVFSMIFSHAPIILPAVTKLPIKIYRPFLYYWFILLQLSLSVRIIADLVGDVLCRKIAGLANGIIILLFFSSIAIIVMRELQKRKLGKA